VGHGYGVGHIDSNGMSMSKRREWGKSVRKGEKCEKRAVYSIVKKNGYELTPK